ncbi:MAG: SGNH/GDSL hydrolase family protein [Deltaproteobacteria bacterium]|nr:SGNH/GDSL hydrolase family protein [Deltaproteobacteria bacterium]
MKKILFINGVILIIGIILIEIVWQIAYSNDIRVTLNVLADTNYDYDISSIYQSRDHTIHYSRDINGFRGNYSNAKDIDVIVIGGSTTDQRYIDDEQTWEHVLESLLKQSGINITIVNAGVDGQSTYGHIKNFDLWFPKIRQLNPNYILFYVGINDFYKDEGCSYDALCGNTLITIKKFIKTSFVYYLYRLVKGIIKVKIEKIGHKPVDFSMLNTTSRPLIGKDKYKQIMAKRLNEYSSRLKTLISKTKKMGAMPIFVTQRRMSYWRKGNQVIGISYQSSYNAVKYNGVDMYYMNKLLNNTTMSVCKQANGICIDLESELNFTHDDFYDFAHNTPRGTIKIGKYLYHKLYDQLLKPAR